MNYYTKILNAYNFFADKYTFAHNGYHGQDKMSPLQFAVMGSLFVIIVIGSILLKRVRKERVFTIYKVLAIFVPIFEIVKISFETYFDLANGQPFNFAGIMPFYTCSMLIFFLPFVAFGKEGSKMKTWSMAFFTTIGLAAGLSNFIYLSASGFYPIFSFGCFYSIIFHSILVFVGMSLMITGIYMPTDYKTINRAMIPVFIFGLIALPINFICVAAGQDWADYMLLYNTNGFFPFADISNWFAQYHLRFIYSILVLVILYPIATALMTYLDIGVAWIVKWFISLFKKKEPEKNNA